MSNGVARLLLPKLLLGISAPNTPVAGYGVASLTLPELTLFATNAANNAGMQLASLTLSATGENGTNASTEQPLRLSKLTLVATGSGINDGSASLTLPKLNLTASNLNFANFTLPQLTLSAIGKTGENGSASVNLGKLTLVATGNVENLGSFNKSLPFFKLTAIGDGGFVGTFNKALKPLRLVASGQTGSAATAALFLPKLTLDADGSTPSVGQAQLTLPSLLLSVVQTISFDGSYQGFALNTNNAALTTYSNYAFNSMTVFNGMSLGASDNGIYQLGGEDDDAVPIEVHLKFVNTDFSSSQQKRLNELFVGYRTDGDMRISLICDSIEQYDYVLQSTGHDGIYTNRVKTGRGIKAGWIQVEMQGEATEFVLDSINMTPIELSRKLA